MIGNGLIESERLCHDRYKRMYGKDVEKIANGLFHYFFWNPSKVEKTVKLPDSSKACKIAFSDIVNRLPYNFDVTPVWYSKRRCRVYNLAALAKKVGIGL